MCNIPENVISLWHHIVWIGRAGYSYFDREQDPSETTRGDQISTLHLITTGSRNRALALTRTYEPREYERFNKAKDVTLSEASPCEDSVSL